VDIGAAAADADADAGAGAEATAAEATDTEEAVPGPRSSTHMPTAHRIPGILMSRCRLMISPDVALMP
jgi:hypothetical protein